MASGAEFGVWKPLWCPCDDSPRYALRFSSMTRHGAPTSVNIPGAAADATPPNVLARLGHIEPLHKQDQNNEGHRQGGMHSQKMSK